MLLPDGTQKKFTKYNKAIDSTFDDFLNKKAALGCTLGSTFRNVIFKNGVPNKMKNLEYGTMERSFRGDTFRSVVHLHYGKAHCVPETDAVYRVTKEGLWQGISTIEQDIINANIFKDLWLYFDREYPELLVSSYRIVNKINLNLSNELYNIKNLDTVSDIVEKLKNLNNLCNKNLEIINRQINKNLQIKYKVLFFIYRKLYKKLKIKGII